LKSIFDREKIIYESKINHLEEFKSKLTQDLHESNIKFENAVNQFNMKNVNDKEKYEKSKEVLIKSLEIKSKENIDKLQTENDRLKNELSEKLK